METSGLDGFLEPRRHALVTRTSRPMRLRHKAIPQGNGKGVRVLSMPTIRDRVVQGAFKLLLEPICEADCQPGSYGYRPKRSAHEAVLRVAEAMVKHTTRVIDVDLQAYCDHVRHHLLVAPGAQRVQDPEVLHVLKLVLHVSGKQGIAPGGVLAPLRSHLSRTAVDRRLERATEVTRRRAYPSLA